MTTTLGGKEQSTNFNDINFKKTKEILKQHLEKTLNKNFESSRTSSNLEGVSLPNCHEKLSDFTKGQNLNFYQQPSSTEITCVNVNSNDKEFLQPPHLELSQKKKSSNKFLQIFRRLHKNQHQSTASNKISTNEVYSLSKGKKKSSSFLPLKVKKLGSPSDMTEEKKSEVLSEVVETLDRLSVEYSHCMHSRSATPGSRFSISESSKSSTGYCSNTKFTKTGFSHHSSMVSDKQTVFSSSNKTMGPKGMPSFHVGSLGLHNSYHSCNSCASRNERHRFVAHSQPQVNNIVDERSSEESLSNKYFVSSKTNNNSLSFKPSKFLIKEESAKGFSLKETVNNFGDASERKSPFVADVDKLVQGIAQCIRLQGDKYNISVNTLDSIPFEPAVWDLTLHYVQNLTYSGFQELAQRFCTMFQPNVFGVPSSHPDVFPFLVVFDMTRFVYHVANSETATGAAGKIVDYSSTFIADMVERTHFGWEDLLEQLRQTENEFLQAESFGESSNNGSYFDVD